MKLINMAVIQSSNPSSSAADWLGILVSGTSTLEQYSTFPDPNTLNNTSAFDGVLNTNQTSLIVDNSFIYNATLAIESVDGGIVRVINSSTLEKCFEFIKIGKYKSVTMPEVNACCVINSNLIWSTNYSVTDVVSPDGRAMLRMNDVSGVLIGGSVFDNQYSALCCDRGTGIYARGSDFKVTEGGEVFCAETELGCSTICNLTIAGRTRSKFYNFSNAILAWPSTLTSGANEGPAVSIRYSDFKNNMLGISAYGGLGIRIDNNTFNSSTLDLNTYYRLPNYIGCSGSIASELIDIEIGVDARDFKIYSNSFLFDGYFVTSTSRAVHHIVSKCSNNFTGLIKKNTFTNSTSHDCVGYEALAILLLGDNQNLEILCNEFTNYGIDIEADHFAGSALVKNVQRNMSQTGSLRSAGNKFYSSKIPNRYRFHNDPSNGIDYHCVLSDAVEDPISYGETEISMGITKIDQTANVENGTDCDLTCESFLTSVGEIISDLGKLKIFPQPGNFQIYINLSEISVRFNRYQVFDMQGRLVFTGDVSNSENIIINTSTLLNGMYLIRLYNELNQSISNKFIIQH